MILISGELGLEYVAPCLRLERSLGLNSKKESFLPNRKAAAVTTNPQQTVISSVMLASMSISLALMAVAQPHNVSVTPVDI